MVSWNVIGEKGGCVVVGYFWLMKEGMNETNDVPMLPIFSKKEYYWGFFSSSIYNTGL